MPDIFSGVQGIKAMPMEEKRAVLYLRLSKEDVNKVSEGDDSASIVNQRLLLTDFALSHGFKIVGVYSDDDESGLFDDRPEFERLMTDAKLGRFDVVIAKTQSRFTRNMEHLEKYLHHDFELLNIRFIGAVDNVDTANKGNKKARQINGLVNEWYCEDLSANIRDTFRVKMKDGQFLGASAPYGYIKDEENHNHLVVDEYAAGVVRKIFRMYLAGYGKAAIGTALTQKGILIPSEYKKQVLNQKYYNPHILKTTKVWSYQTIHTILNNEVYLGKTVQNRCSTISYKNRKKKALPKEQWIVVPGTHEAVIDSATFEMVQRLQKVKKKSVASSGRARLFDGKLVCGGCGHAMGKCYGKNGRGFTGYICTTYKRCGREFCSSHTVKEEELEQAVLESLKREARSILTAEDIEELKKFEAAEEGEGALRNAVGKLEAQLDKIQRYRKKSYENFMDGVIGKEDYRNYEKGYEEEEERLVRQIAEREAEMKSRAGEKQKAGAWETAFKDYIGVERLTRIMVVELIDRITAEDDGSITVRYRFQNPGNCG